MPQKVQNLKLNHDFTKTAYLHFSRDLKKNYTTVGCKVLLFSRSAYIHVPCSLNFVLFKLNMVHTYMCHVHLL